MAIRLASWTWTSVYFASQIEADEAPVLDDEVELVAELVGLPVERRVHRQAEAVADAVEHDVLGQRRGLREADRDVLEPELVAPGRTQLKIQDREALIGQAEVALGVDLRAGNAELLARHDDVGGGEPEPGARFDVVALAGGRVVQRAGLVLRRGRRGAAEQQRGSDSPTVKTMTGCIHLAAHIGVFAIGL